MMGNTAAKPPADIPTGQHPVLRGRHPPSVTTLQSHPNLSWPTHRKALIFAMSLSVKLRRWSLN
jgi:hypothetical protein